MISLDRTVGLTDDEVADAAEVAAETMRRTRFNIETLVESLPATGYVFQPGDGLATHLPPTQAAAADLDSFGQRIGSLPLSLRSWYLEVGEVNLMGSPPAEWCEYPDPLVVQAPVDYVLGERNVWESDRGTEWDRGPFVIDFSPDYLHKADISGGSPYSIDPTDGTVDGQVLWERSQTNFVNYLRNAFRFTGMPGFGFSERPLPPELTEIASGLQPI
ncbi:hypothetical protein BH10ACT3_BH10ACT3_15770 [soil metagenome]